MKSKAGARRAAFLLLVALLLLGAVFFLYFFGITRTGLIGPDEPRYAAIGHAMAATGDWVTPRLWGVPWFEKPALLYWMTAAAFKLGLGRELAPRLPVALASVTFLIYFFLVLGREFGERAAWYATAILGTSAGWLAYSHVAITDLPMSAAFAAAMLAVMPRGSEPQAGAGTSLGAGALLGLAVLAKGLVPLVLFVPALWFLRRQWRELAMLFAAAVIVALPWYALVSARNPTFVSDFIWKHHFGRFLNTALQHGQPVWFYVPVLLAGFFPWTPLVIAPAANARMFRNVRLQFLLAWFVWGFVFFSASRNKLPGYVLPLLPPLAVLMGIGLEKSTHAKYWLAACGALFCLEPPLLAVLPQALANGLSHTTIHAGIASIAAGVALAAMCVLGRPDRAVAGLALFATVTVVWVVWRVYPEMDRELSGRQSAVVTCLPQTNRSQRYSLEYYAGRSLEDCK